MDFDKANNKKIKTDKNLLEVIKEVISQTKCTAKLILSNILLDFNSCQIDSGKQTLILIKDRTQIKEREKTIS